MNDGLSLYELQKRIKGCLEEHFSHFFWIRAEVSSVKTHFSGHCYLELIDKGDSETDIRAKAKGVVWSSSWRVLRKYFVSSTGSDLAEGMSILVKAQVQYTELYGLNLVIYDIDPSFSVGEAELRRRKVMERLRQEGMFEMNRNIGLPPLPKRFAVISSESAAGYRDFLKHLYENEYRYSFYTRLYPAPMQGGTAPDGIVSALEQINRDVEDGAERFDAVLIVRGGGSSIDLACFDDYDLCANVAQFPLPVMVAVGHDQDYHICDMVASVSVKTPTALADYLLEIFMDEDAMLSSLASRLVLAMGNKFAAAGSGLDGLRQRLEHSLRNIFIAKGNSLALYEQRVVKGDPSVLLKAGYCVAEISGKRMNSIAQAQCGERVRLIFKDGELECRVEEIIKR